MTVLPDYVTGTITLANGSTTVTGTETMFATAAFRPGDTLQIQNLTAIIASVDSNTSLTLTEPWTGTSLTNAPYRARYLPDGARVTAQTTTLFELLGNGVLTNLAELGVEEGKAPVGGPTGEYELVDTSSFGIQDPKGSLGKLAALTLAANKILNTDGSGNLTQSDIAAWAISMLGLVGAANKFPYLNAGNTAALADITALGRALLALTGTNGNIPVMTGAGTVASRPIMGTVSQSGGIPTGAIVERGGAADFGYIRDASGLQICWRISAQYSDTSVAKGNIFGGNTIAFGAFPAAFAFLPSVTVFGTDNGGGGWAAMEVYHTATSFGSYSIRNHKALVGTSQIYAIAVGRWY